MNTTSLRIRFASAAAALAITFVLLQSVCAIADHNTAVQVAAAKAAHPPVVALGR
jgi:hypothetical protein